MTSKAEANKVRRQIIGARLKEAIDRANLTQARLLYLTKLRYGESMEMKSSQLSMIISGLRSIPPEFIGKFSEVLDIDPGYLTGIDDLKASDYSEYLKLQGRSEEINEQLSTFMAYYNILAFAGYSIEHAAGWEDQEPDYNISRRGKSATISTDQLEQALDDIRKYMKKRIEPLLDL